MAEQGVDYSTARPGGAALKAAGKTFAVRYVNFGGSTPKYLTAAERDDLHDHGIAIAMVFESYTNRASEGYGAGVADAKASDKNLRDLGFPGDTPVYFAVDWDASAAEQPAIDAYLRGAASVLGAALVGVYGSYAVVDRCHRNGTARWLWQTYAWSDGVHPEVHLYQYRNATNLDGTGPGPVDLTEARKSPFGGWKRAGSLPGPALPPVWQQMWEIISAEFPDLRLTDSVRRLDNGQLDPGSYHGSYGDNDCCAIDIAGAEPDPDGNARTIEVTNWIANRWPNITELIHTPAGANGRIKRGQKNYPYSDTVMAAHGNHIHAANDVAVVPGYTTPQEDDMPAYTDWPKADRDAMLKDISLFAAGFARWPRADQDALLNGVTNTAMPHFKAPVPGGKTETLKDLLWRVARMEGILNSMADPAGLAALIAANMPPGSVDQATVEAGVRAVFAEAAASE